MNKKIKIFVASSGELIDERQRVNAIVDQVRKYREDLEFDTVKWETDVEGGTFDGPIQDRINKELLDCDILLFLIGKRLGKYSLQEFYESRKQRKKIFVYFKHPITIESPDEIEGITEVMEFKKKLEQENRTLYTHFRNTDQLQNVITKDLNLYLNNAYPRVVTNEPSKVSATSTPVPPPRPDNFKEVKDHLGKYGMYYLGLAVALFLFIDVTSFFNSYRNMVRIPKGTYTVGRPANTPFMDVLENNKGYISKDDKVLDCNVTNYTPTEGFYISKFEVTNKEYKAFLAALEEQGIDQSNRIPYWYSVLDTSSLRTTDPARYQRLTKYLNDEMPVLGVSYNDALAFAEWKGMALPTPEQWEVAARHNQDSLTLYPWGNSFEQGVCHTEENRAGNGYPLPVNSPEIGLTGEIFGLIGNADEWVYSDSTLTSAEIRGGNYADPGELFGIIHNKVVVEKNDVSKRPYYLTGFRLAVPFSLAINKDLSNMVKFDAKIYPLGFKITSPILKSIEDPSEFNLYVLFNEFIFSEPVAEPFELNYSFYIDKYEVTFDSYNKFYNYLIKNPEQRRENFADYQIPDLIKRSEYQVSSDENPVCGLGWNIANHYLEWVGKQLPSKREMLIAMAGPENNLYPWGDDWINECCIGKKNQGEDLVVPADTTLVNPKNKEGCESWTGAYHLVGNVNEWLLEANPEDDNYAFYAGSSWNDNCMYWGWNFVTNVETKKLNPESTSSAEFGFRGVKRSPKRLTWKLYELLFL